MSKIDLNIVWDDAKAMGLANKDLLMAIAGMFLLLPGVLADQLMGTPPTLGSDASAAQIITAMADHFMANWPVVLGHELVTSFGALAMLTLLLRPERLTVGESLKAALVILPGYFVARLLQNFSVWVGIVLFILPGFYLFGRLAIGAAAAAAERRGNPIEILTRSFELTRGNGWRIAAMFTGLYLIGMIVAMVGNVLVGLVATLLLPADVASLALSVVAGLVEATLGALVALVMAALYRAVTMPAPQPFWTA